MEVKRKRGRPPGSGKNDDLLLAAIADRLVRDPSLTRRSAIVQTIIASNGNGVYAEALLRRLQDKWNRVGAQLLADAQKRAKPQPARRSLTIAEMVAATGYDVSRANSMAAFATASPAMQAVQRHLRETDPFRNLSPAQKEQMLGFSSLRGAADVVETSRLAAAGRFLNSPQAKMLADFVRSPAAKQMAEFAASAEGRHLADIAKLGMLPQWLKGQC